MNSETNKKSHEHVLSFFPNEYLHFIHKLTKQELFLLKEFLGKNGPLDQCNYITFCNHTITLAKDNIGKYAELEFLAAEIAYDNRRLEDLEFLSERSNNPKLLTILAKGFIEKNDIYKTPLVGHNIHFDKGFLNALFKQGETNPLLHTESEDTMRIWRNLQKQNIIPRHLRATLGTLANHFQIDYTKAHDALADCHITAQVYHKMLLLQ